MFDPAAEFNTCEFLIHSMFIVNLVLVGAVAALISWCVLERAAVRRFALAATQSRRDPWDAARVLAGHIYSSIPKRNDDPVLHRLLRSLGALPTAVMRNGGCCSGISRLYILALETVGASAAQITLYHTSGVAQHCLVEVSIDGVRQAIDPSYGIMYQTADGHPMSLTDLQAGIQPRFEPLPFASCFSYPNRSYFAFDFVATKTANWTLSRARRLAYRVLSRVPFLNIDRLLLPPSLEWPQLIIAGALGFGLLALDALALLM